MVEKVKNDPPPGAAVPAGSEHQAGKVGGTTGRDPSKFTLGSMGTAGGCP